MPEKQGTSNFAPYDDTDGRQPGEWTGIYPQEAYRHIYGEAIYLGAFLVLAPIAILTVWIGTPIKAVIEDPERYRTFTLCAYSWLGGTLGGTVFAIKWLYHKVARRGWHKDRTLWRVFTPHIAAAMAFAFYMLFSSGFLSFLNTEPFCHPKVVLGTSFVIGYFSDSAAAKLTEIAQTLFGAIPRSRDDDRGNDTAATATTKQPHP